MLLPARPPFFLASVGICGLGCEGNGWLSPRRRCLGPSRFRVVFPAGGRMVEASSVLWNKVLRPFLCLVVIRSGAGDGLVRLGFVGFEDQVVAPDLGGPCTGVCLLSSLVLLVLFLMFLEACVAVSGLGWFTLFGVVEVWEGVSRSKRLTAEVLSMRISCSFLLRGVCSLIWLGQFGGSFLQRAIWRRGRKRCQFDRRRKMHSRGLVVISFLLRVLSVKI